jgi:glycosyltransferase involved in cell wall biosynthesis
MIPTPQADVIVPWERHLGSVQECVRSVLEYSGPTMHRLFVVAAAVGNQEAAAALQSLAARDARLQLLLTPSETRFAGRCNHALGGRIGDAVLLRGDCVVTRDWLFELAAVAHSEERTACASPLVNGGGSCSVPELFAETRAAVLDETLVRRACAGLPRWTVAPLLTDSCIYLRGDVMDAVGLLDARLSSPSAALNDWVLRAAALGFAAKRCNHAYVHRLGADQDGQQPALDLESSLSELEHGPHCKHQIERFRATLDGHLAAHAVRLETTGKLRVAYDIRHLPTELTGTRTYAMSLGRALGELHEIELTLLVRDPAQARGLLGRILVEDQWLDSFEVIHKPAQVFDSHELELLYGSNAHLIITYQDLIAYRTPMVFPTDEAFERYRATSSLTLPTVQHVIAYSKNAAQEISAEFGVPRQEIAVVPLGVEAEWFSHREPHDWSICRELGLPARYFFSLATDFQHKNLGILLDAHAILRDRWRGEKPPALVLAGHTTEGRTGIYKELGWKRLAHDVMFLGPVSRDQLRVLYQHAMALVFPSLYEGFGLPPLEAMAAGTAVIAMPISAVPEVGGDCILYPEGLTASSLARSMESLATDQSLRETLCARGLKKADEYRWESTARATLEVYRATVARPSDRSLQMRRLLRDAILRWADHSPRALPVVPAHSTAFMGLEQPVGIRNAWRALNVAVGDRLGREVRRLPLAAAFSRSTGSTVATQIRGKSLFPEETS